jgi:putative ABC transport system permease protein
VIGVVKDFNFESIRSTITSFALFHNSSKTYGIGTSMILVKADAKNMPSIVQQLEAKWKALRRSVPFEYSFLDKNFESLYLSEQRLGEVFGIFTCLSITRCLSRPVWLVDVHSRKTHQRDRYPQSTGRFCTKPGGLLSKEFIKLVFIAL